MLSRKRRSRSFVRRTNEKNASLRRENRLPGQSQINSYQLRGELFRHLVEHVRERQILNTMRVLPDEALHLLEPSLHLRQTATRDGHGVPVDFHLVRRVRLSKRGDEELIVSRGPVPGIDRAH